MAVCITMYNEAIDELKTTIRGVISNYNELRADPKLKYKKEDMLVFLICDGYENITPEFKAFAKAKGFFDEEVLKSKGFMTEGRGGNLKMKDMRDLMDKGTEKIPLNIIHMF